MGSLEMKSNSCEGKWEKQPDSVFVSLQLGFYVLLDKPTYYWMVYPIVLPKATSFSFMCCISSVQEVGLVPSFRYIANSRSLLFSIWESSSSRHIWASWSQYLFYSRPFVTLTFFFSPICHTGEFSVIQYIHFIVQPLSSSISRTVLYF